MNGSTNWTPIRICKNIHYELPLESTFNGQVRIIVGLQVGILCTVISNLIELCFIAEQYMTKILATYNYPVTKLNIKITVI
jgi:hypothetical protein